MIDTLGYPCPPTGYAPWYFTYAHSPALWKPKADMRATEERAHDVACVLYCLVLPWSALYCTVLLYYPRLPAPTYRAT